MDNPFVLSRDSYKRDINPLGHYLKQATEYLSRSTGVDPEICKNYIKEQLRPGGKFEFKDPVIHHTLREDYKDRIVTQSTVMKYINESIQNQELIAPTLTTYVNPKEKESILVGFIDSNVKERSIAKKKMFSAKMLKMKYNKKAQELKDNNEDPMEFLNLAKEAESTEKIQKTVQGNKKTYNNSLSGGHVSASTPISNKTAHSTLTSTCRMTSGYGNANNEKFVSGNRHYFSFEVTLNNVVSIVTNSDYELISEVMSKYSLHYPTVEETMKCITYSTNLYWRDVKYIDIIREYVSKLTPIERAAFVYTGDFYHLMVHNEMFVRRYLTKLSHKATEHHPDPLSVLKRTSDDISALACQICDTEMKGVDMMDAFAVETDDEGNDILDANGNKKLLDPHRAGIVAATIDNIINTLQEYKSLIRAFWVTDNLPASVSHFPTSIRRVALVSDTDSTIFTVQKWIQWFYNSLEVNEKSLGLCATVVFLTSQTITHILAKMSANFGISEERIHQIAMKNEFRFDGFVPAWIGKHYYAVIGCQEGKIYDKYGVEIKGAHLRSSNAPKEIIDKARDLMINGILKTVIDGKKISLEKVLKEVADIERHIVKSIKQGSYDYLRLAQIKEAESYTLEEHQSPYQHYTLWNEVFGPKYGMTVPPPYAAVKVSVLLDSKRKMNIWLDSLEDIELANRMRDWLVNNHKKNGLGTFQLPDQILNTNGGIPDEIFKAMDVRRIILDATGIFYIILETLGYYSLDEKRTKLISDYY